MESIKSRTVTELSEKYDLELDKVLKEIKENEAKLVLLQFPNGLKPYGTAVVDYLRENTKNVEFLIWLGSCFGACDTPTGLEKLKPKIDLVVQFGHSELMPSY
jgi:2-(3-amino-3-carboxypropyl)histidine synthase